MFTGANLGLAKLLQPATGITPACLPTSFYTDWHRLERGEYLRNCVATGFGKTSKIYVRKVCGLTMPRKC